MKFRYLLIFILFCLSNIYFKNSLVYAQENIAKELNIIRNALSDPDREVKILALESVLLINDKQSLNIIKNLLKDNNEYVRLKASYVLYKMGDDSGLEEIKRILTTKIVLSDNPTPVQRAKAIARGSIRAEAANILGDIKDLSSKELLKKFINDEDGRVADACLVSLAKMGESYAIKEFVSALESTNKDVRAKAAQYLGEIGDKSVIPKLRLRIKDWNRDVKIAAILGLAKLKDTESLPAIYELLWDKDDILREKACVAIGLIGSLESIPKLKKMLEDPNGMVRIAASEALSLLGQNDGIPFLIKAIKTNERDAQIRSLLALEKSSLNEEIYEIQELIDNPDKIISLLAARAVILARNRN